MIPAAFEYTRPSSLDEAIQALAAGGEDAKVIAGGQSLTPLLAMRLARPSVLLDVGRLPLGGVAAVDVFLGSGCESSSDSRAKD